MSGPVLAGVIGDPVAHSLSPRLHRHWLRRHGIDGHYVPLRTRAEDLPETLRLLPRLGFAGVNVTIPHKEAIFALADHVSDRARRAGTANTLVFRGGAVHADTTDGPAFVANLRDRAPGWRANRPAVVLGAGGAARGIVAALMEVGVPEAVVINRTAARAEALTDLLGAGCVAAPWSDIPRHLPRAGLLVNATSLGMAGKGPLEIDLSPLPPDAAVADIVYVPLETPLLHAARARGLVAVDGLGMLLHQAVPGFAAWFGITPEVDADLRAAVLG